MIRVAPAPEPADFDATVRMPGRIALMERVGEDSGRPGKRYDQRATSRAALKSDDFPPIWREALPDLLEAYGRICAFLCVYIPRGTGAPSVDHFWPKSRHWTQVYEWNNYRLACSLVNGRKRDAEDILDPFEVQDGWFELEPDACQLRPAPTLTAAERAQVEATLDLLKLNDDECRGARDEYVAAYKSGEISWSFLSRRAPFVARELRRQGLLRPGDG